MDIDGLGFATLPSEQLFPHSTVLYFNLFPFLAFVSQPSAPKQHSKATKHHEERATHENQKDLHPRVKHVQTYSLT